MTKLIIKLLIHNSENTTDSKVRENYGKVAGLIGIITNSILSAAKILIGVIYGSIAMIADGMNNLTDAGSSIITMVGFKLAGQPEDKDHPFGHARYEYISGLMVSILIIVVGVQLIREAINKILNPEPLTVSYVTVIVLIIAILLKFWQMKFYLKFSNLISSTALKATAQDSRNDVIATSAVLLSMIITKFAGIQLDGIMGAVVGLFVTYSGIQLVRETINPLLGTAPDIDLVREIRKRVTSYEGVLGIHDLVVHEYGHGKSFASIHVEVSAEQDVLMSHDLIDNIEREISEQLNMHFVIHMDPVAVNDEATNKLKEIISKMLIEIEPKLLMHDFRYVPGYTHSNLIFDVVIPIGFEIDQIELKELIIKKIKEIDETFYAIVTIEYDFCELGDGKW